VSQSTLSCALRNCVKEYRFPAGIFEINEQLLVPENVSIIGVNNPNDMLKPTKTPNWTEHTLFLATRGAIDYHMNYCHAADMVSTRVGFVLSSYVTVSNLGYQGIDTIRPQDNGALCGGAAFETKGCAENSCSASGVNNGGSDGFGSLGVKIMNVRINDYYYAEDRDKIGVLPEPCCSDNQEYCHFCHPNNIRSTQVGIWVPDVRNDEGTRDLFVNNVVSRSHQADGINLHGNIHDSHVQNAYMENTGDDMFVLWGADKAPSNITFQNCTAVNPGVTRPGWYGNCAATYGVKSLVFDNLCCNAPTLASPFPGHPVDDSMFVFFHSFGANYPKGSIIEIKGWTFQDLNGRTYTPDTGSVNQPTVGKMAWTQSDGGVVAPYYYVGQKIENLTVSVTQMQVGAISV